MQKRIRAIDLAVTAGRKRQNPRTGFVHIPNELIPMYENFCFALALFRQKTTTDVLEAKDLVERLLHFQTPDGNFPIFLHDYPRSWDLLLALKIAPVLLYLLREFSPVLGETLKGKLEQALQRALQRRKEHSPLWEMRYQACIGGPHISYQPSTKEEWFEWLINRQLVQAEASSLPYHRKLQRLISDGGLEPHPIEWLLAESDGHTPRLLQDHPAQLYTALLWPVSQEPESEEQEFVAYSTREGFRLLWDEHDLFLPGGKEVTIPLGNDPERGDLFEVEAFVDLGVNISLAGKRGTVFALGEPLWIETDRFRLTLQFSLKEGSGEFCGHISRTQNQWRIALRTLRKSTPCVIQTEVATAVSSLFLCSEELSTASPIA